MLKRAFLFASVTLVAAQSSNSEPCAIAASQLEGSGTLEAETAYDCLESVPVDTQGNARLIDELKQVWQFHSELDWLKNPGEDWEFGSLDIEGGLDNIKSNLGSYSSEYAVQLAIQNITIRTGNFHFNYRPDILQVFQFIRPLNVASISSDGKELPKLYIAEDVSALAEGSSDVSEISSINGQDPYDFLRSTSFAQYIDSDGLINNMLAKGDTDNLGDFSTQRKYDGSSTDIEWANGTTVSITNGASTEQDFFGVTDGQSFFDTFCTGFISGAIASSASTKARLVSPSAPGKPRQIPTALYHIRNKRQTIPTTGSYPTAIAADSSGTVAGYFLNGDGYEDVAVLKIISFSNPYFSEETEYNNEFQSTIQSFLSECISENKQKLIIDLRENGGGNTNLLLDAFMQLFPEMEPFSAQRYRATDAFVKIGDAINEIRGDTRKSREYASLLEEDIETGFTFRYWSWWHFRNAEGTDFNGWDQFNGPLDLNSDDYTANMRYNYTDEVSILPEGFQFVNGTRSTPFNASNVVMYTDALCGSSCASFHEELKNIAGVKAVTVGGRPTNAPIQTTTGSKGGEVSPLINWPLYATYALNLSTALSLSSFKDDDDSLSPIANVPQIFTRVGDASSRLQSQDQVRKGDASATPLQYIYDAADCKIFYTPDSYADPDAAWKQAWDAFSDDAKCVEGSTGHKSSISGGFKAFGAGDLQEDDQPTESSGGGGGGGSGNGDGSGGEDEEDAASSLRVSSVVVSVAAVAMGMMMM